MGIDGLLNLVKSITKRQHISTFRDQTIGIDALPWLYKGCYATPYEDKGNKESIHFLYYMMEMIDLLKHYNIKPIIVFDGKSLRMKKDTNEKRSRAKQESKQKGLQLLEKGELQEAKKFLSRCIIIDQRIVSTTMRVLKSKNVEFMVAPYEADTQLAKLKKLNIIDAAISEDSDLLVYGINVLFKLNQNGDCDYVDIKNCDISDADNEFLKLYLEFPYNLRVDSAILAGSDYSQSIHGIGIKRAIKLLHKEENTENVIKKLKNQKVYKQKIPQNYEQSINQVKLIFHFATTYNPISQKLQQLSPESLDTIKPENMSLQELLKVVGQHINYTEQIRKGQISIKDMTKRNLQPLSIPGDFSVNKQNLLVYQQLNKKRRIQQVQDRKRKQQQEKQKKQQKNPEAGSKSQEPEGQQQNEKKGKKKVKVQKLQLTQQQKNAKKQERKNRIVRLQNMMNTAVQLFQNFDNPRQEQKEQNIQGKIFEQQQQVNERSLSIPGLDILNPFAKPVYKSATIDVQTIIGKQKSQDDKNTRIEQRTGSKKQHKNSDQESEMEVQKQDQGLQQLLN